jgi:hypothetical protein
VASNASAAETIDTQNEMSYDGDYILPLKSVD